MIFYGELWNGRRFRQQRNRRIWFCKMENAQIFYPVAISLNQRYLESLGCWACPGNPQTGHITHWRTRRIHLSVSSVVNSPLTGKCGRLRQHFWLRLDAVAVTPCLVQCLKPAAWAKKILTVFAVLAQFIMVFILADTKRTSYMDYTFPLIWDLLGWAIPILISLCIPLVAVVKIVNNRTSSIAKVRGTTQLNLSTLTEVFDISCMFCA